MVTATGIFLGFMLNYTSNWLPTAFTDRWKRDIFVAVSISTCIAFLIIVLFRILRMNYPRQHVEQYYQKTLKLFLIAISIPFFAFLIIMIEKFVTNVLLG